MPLMRLLSSFLLPLAASSVANASSFVTEPAGLHRALEQLARSGQFSGAVVIRGPEGVNFAHGYGWADPFEKRAFTPETPADSGSLAKPVTAAAILLLIQEGQIELDAPVRRYLPEYPQEVTTVRHLLSHSAGLELQDSADGLANKSNAQLLAEAGPALFRPGTAFTYCNLCSITLALLIERVSRVHYLDFVRRRVALPPGVELRPARLSDWRGRAIGYHRKADGELERFDSWEGEQFYGPANFSISAAQLAEWGSEWWRFPLQSVRQTATAPARIGASESGLTLGNWYCATSGRRCHYLGHHEGFHHMLYWDADRRISIAMFTNNTLAPDIQQRLQRAIIAFTEGAPARAKRELKTPLPNAEVPVGRFSLSSSEVVEIVAHGARRSVRRRGLEYPAYAIGSGIRYVPGLDLYIAGSPNGGLRWLTLYEDLRGAPI